MIGLVADIDAGAVRRERHPVRGLDALQRRYRAVAGGIDDVDVVTAAVGGVDAHCFRESGWCGQGKECNTGD
jgi:hypothetical protein